MKLKRVRFGHCTVCPFLDGTFLFLSCDSDTWEARRWMAVDKVVTAAPKTAGECIIPTLTYALMKWHTCDSRCSAGVND